MLIPWWPRGRAAPAGTPTFILKAKRRRFDMASMARQYSFEAKPRRFVLVAEHRVFVFQPKSFTRTFIAKDRIFTFEAT